MEFKNGYNLLYQKLKAVYASKTGRPNADDQPVDFGLTEEEIAKIKLVYETKDNILVSYSNIPTEEDLAVAVTVDGESVIGPSGDTPATGLNAAKAGDRFIDFHFDTSLTPNKDDFNWTEADGYISVIAAFNWHQRGSSEDIDGNAFAAQYIPAGTMESEEEEGRYNKEIFIIMDFNGNFVYVNDVKEVDEFLGGGVVGSEDGWQVGSFKEFIEKYEIDWDLSEDSYGELLTQIPGENDYIPDYVQTANGKYYGFKQSDYYKQPGPTPTSLIPFSAGQTIKGFDFGNVKNGDVNADLSNFLLTKVPEGGSESTTGYFVIADGDNALIGVNLNSQVTGLGMVFIPSGSSPIILYATQDFTVGGISGTKGFQNLTDGKYIISGSEIKAPTVSEVSVNIEDTSWNGTLIGAVEAEPGPTPPPGPLYTMEAFEIGDDLGIGAKIHFDTSKSSELENLISSYDYDDSGMYIMFYTERLNLMIAGMDLSKATQGATSGYVLQVGNGQDMMGVLYSTVDAEIQGKTIKAGWNYIEDGGFIDSDDNITTIYGEHNMVIEGSINENSNPELWNGVIFGKAVLVGE